MKWKNHNSKSWGWIGIQPETRWQYELTASKTWNQQLWKDRYWHRLLPCLTCLDTLNKVTMKMHLFLKQPWNQNKDWYDTMEEKDLKTWRQIISKAKGLSPIEITWYVGKEQSPLLCFCDASKIAHTTVIYLKTMVDKKESPPKKHYPSQDSS